MINYEGKVFRHYKGGYYRVIAIANNASNSDVVVEGEQIVVYENSEGRRFMRTRTDFEGSPSTVVQRFIPAQDDPNNPFKKKDDKPLIACSVPTLEQRALKFIREKLAKSLCVLCPFHRVVAWGNDRCTLLEQDTNGAARISACPLKEFEV